MHSIVTGVCNVCISEGLVEMGGFFEDSLMKGLLAEVGML